MQKVFALVLQLFEVPVRILPFKVCNSRLGCGHFPCYCCIGTYCQQREVEAINEDKLDDSKLHTFHYLGSIPLSLVRDAIVL